MPRSIRGRQWWRRPATSPEAEAWDRPTRAPRAGPLTLLTSGWVLGAAVRRLSVRTGVSDSEAVGPLPGDDVLPHPMVEWTRGVTVRAAPEEVWPWLAQMGYGRGGWYTSERVDLVVNRWFFGERGPTPGSADRLVPEFQHIAVGDLICDGRDYASFFRVQQVDPPRALVLRSIRHVRRGSPIDISDPASPERVERQLRESGRYIDFTWALVVTPLPNGRSRLLARTRADYAPQSLRWVSTPLGLFDATYGRAMLHAIARRAERRPSSG